MKEHTSFTGKVTLTETIEDLGRKALSRNPFDLMVWDVMDFAAGESSDWSAETAEIMREGAFVR